jgi:type II secretory ATPase GspE/PulE/Tfp pilus assembly ATPase PilB-like protein
VLAQALIKKLCEKCKAVDQNPSGVYERQVYKAVGCPECFNKGTRGRTAMAELLYFNDEVKEWVQNRNLTARDVVQKAQNAGYLIPMNTVAREKVLAGITSEQEVAGVLGLVESERQFSNRAYAESINPSSIASSASREPIDHHEHYIDGEIVG